MYGHTCMIRESENFSPTQLVEDVVDQHKSWVVSHTTKRLRKRFIHTLLLRTFSEFLSESVSTLPEVAPLPPMLDVTYVFPTPLYHMHREVEQQASETTPLVVRTGDEWYYFLDAGDLFGDIALAIDMDMLVVLYVPDCMTNFIDLLLDSIIIFIMIIMFYLLFFWIKLNLRIAHILNECRAKIIAKWWSTKKDIWLSNSTKSPMSDFFWILIGLRVSYLLFNIYISSVPECKAYKLCPKLVFF